MPFTMESAPSSRPAPPRLLPLLERVTPSYPQSLLETATAALGARHGGLVLLSPEGEPAECLTTGLDEEAAGQLRRSAWLGGLVHLIVRRTRPLRLAAHAPELAPLPPAPFYPLGPLLGVAIAGQIRPWGVLFLARPHGASGFHADDEETLLALCGLLKQGSLAEEGQLLGRLRLLTEVAQAAAGNLDLARVFAVALRELDRHLPSGASALWLLEDPPTAMTLAAISDTLRERGPELGLSPELRLATAETCFADCLQGKQAVYADWTRPEERQGPLAERLAAHGATASFAVPLHAGERSVGILQGLCFRPLGFTNAQIQLFYLVADLLGPAISNCQLYSQLRSAYEDLRLTQQKLIQAEKMRALGELAGSMAHEFNNALCGTLGFLDLTLGNPTLDPVTRGYLDSARGCAWDAARTVRSVQAFARPRVGQSAPERFDLAEIVRQTLEIARLRCSQVIAMVNDAAGPAWVEGSAAELRQVMTNLVFNALDAMPQGGTLTLETRVAAGQVRLAVRDTGCGIAPEHLQRLFEPFFSTKGERGNGLGLSVVYGILRRHQGEITVESELGRGSTFTIHLPAAAPAAPAAPGAAASPSATGLRVLVVEDEAVVRQYLATALKHLGHRPRVAASAQEGLAAFAGESFDVVLTDLSLQDGTNGEQLAREIARRVPGLPVVVLTGNAGRLATDLPEGIAAVIGKPVSLGTLATTLAKFKQRS